MTDALQLERRIAQPHMVTSDAGDPVDAFEGWAQFEKENPPGPVRHIELTPDVLAADAALQASRTAPPAAWPIKAELSADNLRTAKRKQLPGRVADHRRFVLAQPKKQKIGRTRKPRNFCTGCNAELYIDAKGDLCRKCIRATYKPSRTCSRCPKVLNKHAKGDMCRACWLTSSTTKALAPQLAPALQETNVMPITLCTGGCGRTICPSALKVGSKYAAGCSKKSGCQQRKRVGAIKPAKKAVRKAAASPTSIVRRNAFDLEITQQIPKGFVTLSVPASALDAFWHNLAPAQKASVVSAHLAKQWSAPEAAL